MLLSINEAKVAELLKSSNNGYAVFTSDVPTVIENYKPAYPTISEASGTVYAPLVLVTAGTKEHLMSVRRQIEESGVPLKSAQELTREIDEMRGRR